MKVNFGRMLIGGVLILIGLNWLARNSGLGDWMLAIDWSQIWPIILIFLGLTMFSWEGKRGVLLGSLVTLLTIVMVILIFFGSTYRQINSFRPNIQLPRIENNTQAEMITENRQVSGFNGVRLDGLGKLIISQGANEELSIEADKRVMELIKTETKDGELQISFDSSSWWKYMWLPQRGVTMRLQVKELNRIVINGAAVIESEGVLRGDSLEVRINGATSGNLNVETKTITSELNGAGNVKLIGKTGKMETVINGAGKWNSLELACDEARVTINGAGNAELAVSDGLWVKIAGGGTVEYQGDPTVEEDIQGAGTVKKN